MGRIRSARPGGEGTKEAGPGRALPRALPAGRFLPALDTCRAAAVVSRHGSRVSGSGNGPCPNPDTHNPSPRPENRKPNHLPTDSALVSLIGSNLAQSVAGMTEAERIEAKGKRAEAPKAPDRRKRDDDTDLFVANTESSEAVRPLKRNDDEEARQDHMGQPGYPKPGSGAAPRHIDLEG